MSDNKINKTIFSSYTDVINKGMKAGRDMSVAVKRLNHLMSEHKKKIQILSHKLGQVYPFFLTQQKFKSSSDQGLEPLLNLPKFSGIT